MIHLNSTVIATNQQLSTDMADETVILNMQDGIYYGLDEVGTFIWQNIQSPISVTTLIQLLLEAYAVDKATAERDIMRLLNDLQQKHLVNTIT